MVSRKIAFLLYVFIHWGQSYSTLYPSNYIFFPKQTLVIVCFLKIDLKRIDREVKKMNDKKTLHLWLWWSNNYAKLYSGFQRTDSTWQRSLRETGKDVCKGVSTKIAPTYCLERVSRPQCRSGKLKECLMSCWVEEIEFRVWERVRICGGEGEISEKWELHREKAIEICWVPLSL